MIGLIAGAALNVGSALLQQRAQRKALEAQQEGLAEQYDLAREMLEQTRPERQTLTQADLIRKQRALEDPIADQQRKEANRQAATNVQALTMAGPRGLAMLGQQQRAAADVQARIGGESERRTERALSDIARREQQIQQFNLRQDQSFREAQAELEMGRLAAEQDITGQLAGLKGSGLAAGLTGLATTATASDEKLDEAFGVGEKGMRLPGKFSHATNPIELMRNGRKIGEATGDEIVLNPEQINKISKQSSYLRKLLKQPRFQ